MTTENVVPEMGRYLRQIVDNSFEEGQFQSGVVMLDQLRSPDHRPSIIHILHLIFIALQPLQETQLNEDESHLDPKTLLLQSPRKLIKHTKSSLTLSASTVIAAQQLLMSFTAVNPPHYIGAALPCYPETKNEPPIEFAFSESMIFNQAVAIKHSKNCWEILKSSFKARTTHLLNTPKAKGRQASRIRFVEPSYADVNDSEDIKIVAEDSWFVLEWLVTLFEKDADATERQGDQRYSPLLLKQLPPPPMGSSAHWDASEPLRVIFFAFQQTDVRRQRSGRRLLALFIELSQTPHLNLPSFVTSVLAQLTTNNNTTASLFDTLFSHLSSSPAVLSFKLALCRKIIEDASDISTASRRASCVPTIEFKNTGNSSSVLWPTATAKKSRVQPRARVKALTAERSLDGNSGVALTDSNTSPTSHGSSKTGNKPGVGINSTFVSPTYVARVPSYVEVVKLSRTTPVFTFSHPQQKPSQVNPHLPNRPWATPSLLTRVKFELLLAYAFVQVHRRELAEQYATRSESASQNKLDPPDAKFAQSVDDGSFAALLDEIFAPGGDNEDEQRVLFMDVLRAVTGLSLNEDTDENMIVT